MAKTHSLLSAAVGLLLATGIAGIAPVAFAVPPPAVRTDLVQTKAAGPYAVSLVFAPNPVRAMRDQLMTVTVSQGNRPVTQAVVSASLTMVGMDMGPNRVALRAIGKGRYQGSCVFPACPSGGLEWRTTITVLVGRTKQTVTFPVQLAPQVR